jgi:hypothetical protein
MKIEPLPQTLLPRINQYLRNLDEHQRKRGSALLLAEAAAVLANQQRAVSVILDKIDSAEANGHDAFAGALEFALDTITNPQKTE